MDVEDPASFFLIVNYQVSVWGAMTVSLVHARNFSSEQQPGDAFADAFGQSSLRASNVEPFSPIHIEYVDEKEAALVPIEPITAEELVRRTLVDAGLLIEGDSPWREHALSITIYGVQQPSYLSASVDLSGESRESATPIGISFFPLRNFAYDANDEAIGSVPRDWFDRDHDEYRIDFQWSSERNLQFFRIERRRVRVR